MNAPDITNELQKLADKVIDTLTGMVTPDMLYIVIGSIVATQAAKTIATYAPHILRTLFHVKNEWDWNPNGPAIVFVLSPLSTWPIAESLWPDADHVPAWVVALAASLAGNIVYYLLAQKLLGTKAPEFYNRINQPVERRRVDAGPPPGVPDRRRQVAAAVPISTPETPNA